MSGRRPLAINWLIVGIDLLFLIAVWDPPERGIGAKGMRGHSGKSAAPRERQLCGQEALLVAVLDVRLRLGLSPTTSRSPRWRAYMAAGSQRQARCRLFSLIL